MVLWKMALYYDPEWRKAFRTKGNWRKLRYWFRRVATDTTGQYTVGPYRLDIRVM